MAANMRDPKPADPLHYRWSDYLLVGCPCGLSAGMRVSAWAAWFNLPDTMTLGDFTRTLRCPECQGENLSVRIEETARGR